jgi:acyl carrier protein
MENVETIVKEYIQNELIHDESASEITNTTPLIAGNVLDSITILRLAVYLEERFDIEVEPHEIGVENMETIDMIADFVRNRS